MSESAKINLAGVQINFNVWKQFNVEKLTNDGVVLFQYLAFHCQSNAEWIHSDSDLLYELGIKRSRLTTLRQRFVEMGFLKTRITIDRNDNKIRAYRIDFLELATMPVLTQIYREEDSYGEPYNNLIGISEIYKKVALKQPKLGAAAKLAVQSDPKMIEVRLLADQMEKEFADRRRLHNDNIRMHSEGKPCKQATGIVKFSDKQLKNLAMAVKAIKHKEYILNAFTVFCDMLNEHITSNSLSPNT